MDVQLQVCDKFDQPHILEDNFAWLLDQYPPVQFPIVEYHTEYYVAMQCHGY